MVPETTKTESERALPQGESTALRSQPFHHSIHSTQWQSHPLSGGPFFFHALIYALFLAFSQSVMHSCIHVFIFCFPHCFMHAFMHSSISISVWLSVSLFFSLITLFFRCGGSSLYFWMLPLLQLLLLVFRFRHRIFLSFVFLLIRTLFHLLCCHCYIF